MRRVALAAVAAAWSIASGAALAEPVRLSDAELDATTAGRGGPAWGRQSNLNFTNQIATARSFAIAICIQCSNSTVTAIAISSASNLNATRQHNSR